MFTFFSFILMILVIIGGCDFSTLIGMLMGTLFFLFIEFGLIGGTVKKVNKNMEQNTKEFNNTFINAIKQQEEIINKK